MMALQSESLQHQKIFRKSCLPESCLELPEWARDRGNSLNGGCSDATSFASIFSRPTPAFIEEVSSYVLLLLVPHRNPYLKEKT